MAASVLGFHNDDEGKQIKINILLSDLSKDSNGLEYAIFSHKVSLVDRFIVSILKFLNSLKVGMTFVNYQKNKF